MGVAKISKNLWPTLKATGPIIKNTRVVLHWIIQTLHCNTMHFKENRGILWNVHKSALEMTPIMEEKSYSLFFIPVSKDSQWWKAWFDIKQEFHDII